MPADDLIALLRNPARGASATTRYAAVEAIERLRAAVTALVPIVEKERARLAINQQKAPERMASSYDGLIAPLDAALRLAGINMRSKE